ncbi:hypothetical protein GF339_04275 [candidate division KSB3 bacterium]|uniref:Uncharacterized protein n=1 Tax=candidate division KSB3 bacterium TaxID=2044937 RepID=A0A9D5Q5C7_9BACT|nr:hypothetical protein [candidate division KSB3 bacterium]MBD3323776.1 hypothetical protein [candidate division KSB3 bacterium]
MHDITYTQVQELVTHVPVTKLPIAYELLRELAAETPETSLPQIEFMSLPLQERQRLLAQQAADLVEHYAHSAEERELWQGGRTSHAF